jgi:putative protease
MAVAKRVGKIDHYYDKIGVAVVVVEKTIAVGDEIEVRDKDGNPKFTQTVSSMQIEHEQVEKAKKGQEIGLKIDQGVKEGDLVYKI